MSTDTISIRVGNLDFTPGAATRAALNEAAQHIRADIVNASGNQAKLRVSITIKVIPDIQRLA